MSGTMTENTKRAGSARMLEADMKPRVSEGTQADMKPRVSEGTQADMKPRRLEADMKPRVLPERSQNARSRPPGIEAEAPRSRNRAEAIPSL